MTALEYLEIKRRMVETGNLNCDMECSDCPPDRFIGEEGIICPEYEVNYPEQTIDFLKVWGDEHPVKTSKDKFLEVFPSAELAGTGEPTVCVKALGLATFGECAKVNCADCWNRPYVDVEE